MLWAARIALHRPAEQIEPMLCYAAQIAAAQRDAVTVEEFEYLNSDLTAVLHPIAKLRGGELPVRRAGGQVDDDPDHLGHRRARKEVVVRDLVHLAHASEQ